jgi:hypothetical protein
VRGQAIAAGVGAIAQGLNLLALNYRIDRELDALNAEAEQMLPPGSKDGVLAVIKAWQTQPPAGPGAWSFESAFLWKDRGPTPAWVIQLYHNTPTLESAGPKGAKMSRFYYWGTRK